MKNTYLRKLALGLATSGLISTVQAAPGIDLLNAFTFADGAAQGGVEIVSYTPDQFTVAGIYVGDTDGSGSAPTTFGTQILDLGATGSLTERHNIAFTSAHTGWALSSVSSVALDPLGRNFGVATLIPTDNTTTLGKLAFFNYDTGGVIGTINAGYHPDSVRFSADGTKLYVANEGEFKPGAAQAPGSLSIVDVSDITSGNLSNLTTKVANTFDFSAANLGSGASLSGIRNSNVAAVGTSGTFINSVPNFTNPANIDAGAIEPEYVTVSGNKAYVTLQDNNAIGVFNLTTNKWDKINNLGKITQTIDATDNAGDGATINDVVKGLPMPDTIASYVVGGKTYLVTANEGDARVDDRDISRFGDIAGGDSMNGILDTTIYPASNTGVRANSALGRLNISRLDGDTDGDGKIDDITMIGTRSFSLWEVQADDSLILSFDSGSLELLLKTLDPAAHNMNRGDLSATDTRSDDKGPEPEGLTIFTEGELTLLALNLERQNGILLYDITDPTQPIFLDYANTYGSGVVGANPSDRLVSPEGSLFIPAADSPTGGALLLVGYEGHDSGPGNAIIEGGIGVFSVTVPEPGSALGLLGGTALLGGLGSLFRRRS